MMAGFLDQGRAKLHDIMAISTATPTRRISLALCTFIFMAFAFTSYVVDDRFARTSSSQDNAMKLFKPAQAVPALPDAAHERLPRFAYFQNVWTETDLCSADMIFASLRELRTGAALILSYPETWSVDEDNIIGGLLRKARDQFGARLSPVSTEISHFTYGLSATRLLALGQTDYDRIMILSPDSSVLKSLDELFFLPEAALAQPYAYWLQDEQQYASQLSLLQPSKEAYERYSEALKKDGLDQHHEEIFEQQHGTDRLVFEHRGNIMVTKEFSHNHTSYLGNLTEEWDPYKEFDAVRFIHFLDGDRELMAKPYVEMKPDAVRDRFTPKCSNATNDRVCSDEVLWQWVFGDFLYRRREICGFI